MQMRKQLLEEPPTTTQWEKAKQEKKNGWIIYTRTQQCSLLLADIRNREHEILSRCSVTYFSDKPFVQTFEYPHAILNFPE